MTRGHFVPLRTASQWVISPQRYKQFTSGEEFTPASVLCFDRNDQENCVRNSPVIHGTVDEAKKKKAARLAAQKARIVITNIIVGRTNDQTTQLASIHRQGIDGCRARCTHGYFYDQRGPGNAGQLSWVDFQRTQRMQNWGAITCIPTTRIDA